MLCELDSNNVKNVSDHMTIFDLLKPSDISVKSICSMAVGNSYLRKEI